MDQSTSNFPDQSQLSGTGTTVPAETWAKLGAGAALVMLGTGRMPLMSLLRLAAIAGGGTLAYRALKDGNVLERLGNFANGGARQTLSDQDFASGSSGSSGSSGYASDRGTGAGLTGLAGGLGSGSSGYGRTSDSTESSQESALAGADGIPPIDLRGA